MTLDYHFLKTAFRSVVLLSCLAACGQTSGCSGCEEGPGNFPAKDRVYNAVQIRITRSGLNFLEENLEPLLAGILPAGGLNICLPGTEGRTIGIDYGFCNVDMCPEGGIGCNLNIALRSVDLSATAPNRLTATIEFDELSARIPIQASPIAECVIAIDGEGFEVGLPLTLHTPDPERYLTFELADQVQYQLSDIDVRLEGTGGLLGFVCDALSFVINFPFIRDLLFDTIQLFVDGILSDQIQGFVEGFMCQSCQDDLDCPSNLGATCDGGQCRFPNGRCATVKLGLDGQLDVGTLLQTVSPGLEAVVDYLAVAGGYAEVENGGISVGLIAGAKSERDRCVPQTSQPEVITPMRTDLLRGNMDLQEGEYHIGVGLTHEITKHFSWALFNAGALCVQITNQTVEQLNAGILSIVLPDLANLAGNPQAPVAITLAPQQVPEVIFGENTFELDEEGNPVLIDPAVTISIPELWLDFHVFMDDRWVRIFSLHANVSVPIGLDFTPNNEVIPIIGDLSQALSDLRTDNAEIMRDDPELLATLLPALLNIFLGDLVSGLINPIALPDLMGFSLDMQDGAITAVENGEVLAIFARLARSEMMGAAAHSSVETEIQSASFGELPTANFLAAGPQTFKKIPLRLVVDAWDGSIDQENFEFSWRIDGSTWSAFRADKSFTIHHPLLLLQGPHRLQVRARRIDNYRTLDPSPAEMDLVLDTVPPHLAIERKNGKANISAYDLVSDRDDLLLKYRIGDAPWVILRGDQIEVSDDDDLTVHVTDEVGLVTAETVSARRSALIGRLPPDERGQAAGCECDQTGDLPPSPMYLLLVIGFLWRRRPGTAVVLGCGLIALLTIGCEDSSGAGNDRDPDMGRPQGCATDEQCDEPNYFCHDKICQLIGCRDDGTVCETLVCPDGEAAQCNDRGLCECVPFCGESCADGTYCCMAENRCMPLPENCLNLNCAEGQIPQISFSAEEDPRRCDDDQFDCRCLDIPPAPIGIIGRFSDLVVHEGTVWVSAYSDTYGDLVVGRHNANGGFQWQWVDGLPVGVEPDANPRGPRYGLTLPGVDVGRYTALAAADDGTLHVAYYDFDNQALKYALGIPAGDGHEWSILVLDDEGDAGRWSSISLDPNGRPGIAYRVGSVEGISQVRYIQATEPRPNSPNGWGMPFILHARILDNPDPETGTYPEGTGLFTSQARTNDGAAVVAWYDRSAGQLYWSRMVEAGFGEPEILAGWESGDPDQVGDMGANVDLTLDAEGRAYLCFQDGLTDSLRYLAPEIGHQEWVDDGVWLDVGGRGHSVHVVGDDCNIELDSQGRPLIVYQDSTMQALLLRRRDRENVEDRDEWGRRQALRGDTDRYTGAFGFYARAVVAGNRLYVSHFIYRNHVEPPASGMEVLIVDL